MAASGAPLPSDHPPVANGQVKEMPVPQPPPSFLLGNLPDMDPEFPARAIQRMADLYGEIYQLDLAGNRLLVLSTQQLINEACDQDRFAKTVNRTLKEVRALTGDGLFTAQHEDFPDMPKEMNWWKAHRLLVPAFGPLGLRKMFDDMLDISAQMVLRWDRMGPEHVIDTADDFTRLAFDTIGLCSFGYRFNEFYTDDAHPFANQMANVLKLSGRRANRSEVVKALHMWEEQERQADVQKMHALVRKIIADRKSHPKPDAKDLLNTMLLEKDRETNEGLSDDNILANMITFLVAGHETTSATLSFMWHNLLKNPSTLLKAQKEVDDVVGDKVVSLDMLPKLPYIDACIKETLRLSIPISATSVRAKQDTYLTNGKYKVNKGDNLTCNLKGLHHDPTVWGDDHNEFKPERFLEGRFAKLPPNSWKPFGNGLRACIGRGFAEQEMLINTAMILQRFNPEMADPGYELQLRATLTVKPEGFNIRVRRRPNKTALVGVPGGISSDAAKVEAVDNKKVATSDAKAAEESVKIFYGGNSGTCEGFGQALEAQLSDIGVPAQVASLDAATEHLATDAVNVIVTASYEGKPPDNAKLFVSWLEGLDGTDRLKNVRYTVMGVGNSDWATTFHRIPRLIDEKLAALGARRVVPAGYSNVKEDLIGPFEDWSEALLKRLGSGSIEEDKPSLKAHFEVGKMARELADEKMGVGTVLMNDQLADNSIGPQKKHMEVRLPEGMAYEAGDYLVIQPKNPDEAVRRVMRFFRLAHHTKVSFSGSKKRFLPTEPVNIALFLFGYVELQTPITKRQLSTLIGFAKSNEHKQALEKLQSEDEWSRIQTSRYTVLDVLEEVPVTLPFEAYVDMLLPLTPRQYSISSSPLAVNQEDKVSITYDVHTSPAHSGHGIFEGVCSTFLSSRRVGDQISCFVRGTNVGFRLPGNLETPVIMFAAGTGIAPMRAFLQERAALASAGSRKLGPALLFFGCRDEKKDFLYRDQLSEWEQQGIVQVFGCHSRSSEKTGGPKYVQDAVWEQRELVADLFRQGGKIYLCGSAARLGQSSAAVCKKIWMEKSGKGEKEADEWLDSVKTDRYVSDVY